MPIKLDNASKRIGNKWIFRDISFDVLDGEIFAIFGPNGAGKSNLLRSIDDGEYVGTAPNSVFGRVFSNGLENAIDRLLRYESSINKANGPLLLDEPFCGLDAEARRRLYETIKAAASSKNLPVIFSTPTFADVLSTADRTAILANGYIQQIGNPQGLYDEPANHLVASLIGRNNLFEARRLTSSKAELPEFQTIQGGHRLFTQKLDLKNLGAIHKNAFLSIRPEQISLSFGASFPEDNLLKAIITGIDFEGATTIVSLDCEGLKLGALVMRLVGLNIGDECMVGLPPDRIRVLAD